MQSLKPIQFAFISYAHEDAEFALRLAKDLRAAGAAVWIDRLDIKVGQRWDRAVEDALAKYPQVLVILSPASVDSTNVMDEVSFALDKGKTVLPVIHRQCEIPFRLRRLHYVDLTLNYDGGLGRLLEALGFAEPPSNLPEDAVKQVERGRTGPSGDDSPPREEGKLPEDAVKPVEQGRAGPSGDDRPPGEGNWPKKLIFGLLVATIVVVALILAWATLKPNPRPPRPGPSRPAAPIVDGKFRVFLHLGKANNRAVPEEGAIKKALEAQGFVVVDSDGKKDDYGPGVDYFHDEDKNGAQRLASLLNRLLPGQQGRILPRRQSARQPPGTLGVWF